MKEYIIYWVNPEIYQRYFYKSDILYRFFLSCHDEMAAGIRYVDYQFRYITRKFPGKSLLQYLSVCVAKQGWSSLYEQDKLQVFPEERYLRVVCDSLSTAENTIFPCLRKYDDSFFIMEPSAENCGWLSPITKSEYQSKYHLLYSSL